MLQVAYICDVTHVAYLVAWLLQPAEKQVKGDGRARMTQMAVAVHGWAAHVHSHVWFIKRCEALLAAGQGIVDKEIMFHFA